MLQQTQVDRVIPYYERWIKKYPTAKCLAKANLVDVLTMWQGLGYNRRAKYLWESAKRLAVTECVKKGEMNTPPTPFFTHSGQPVVEFFESLPGVGHYTARAIAAFAYNSPEVFVETNIRTVFFHHDTSHRKMSDAQLLPLVAEALKKSKMQPRDFYAALMDYGSYLKKSGVKLNSRSKHYTKQSKFEGSRRQKNAAKLRELLKRGAGEEAILRVLNKK